MPAERICFFSVPNAAKILLQQVAKWVFVPFVVAAWQYFARHSDDTSGPEAAAAVSPLHTIPQERRSVSSFSLFNPIYAIRSLEVAAVAFVGGHERMTMLIVVELSSFEDETVCAQLAVVVANPIPFVLIGAQT